MLKVPRFLLQVSVLSARTYEPTIPQDYLIDTPTMQGNALFSRGVSRGL